MKQKHELKAWMHLNRITGPKKTKERFGVTQAVFTHIYNGGRVSDSMLEKLEAEGVPKSIVNKLRKQGI